MMVSLIAVLVTMVSIEVSNMGSNEKVGEEAMRFSYACICRVT